MQDVLDWLVSSSHGVDTAAVLIHEVASRLRAAGIDIVRINLQIRPLSPLVDACHYAWKAAESEDEVSRAPIVTRASFHFENGFVMENALARGAFDTDAFRRSPFFRVIEAGDARVRARIAPDQIEFDYPILADLQRQGATDYVAYPFRLRGMLPSAVSFTTGRAGGFRDDELDALARLLPAFQLAMSPFATAYAMRAVLGAYLGGKTADRVLSGQVLRGDVAEIDAAIWFSDLRGFTPMSAGVAPAELVGWLNEYFDAIARAIAQHDGEILKFIGDAILAVWPAADCAAALSAARDANLALDALNQARGARGLAALDHGIGLHVGTVQYGNIGATGRLDFTVIGPAVNLASRLEGASGKLGRRLIASADFAARTEGLAPVAELELKGIAGAQRVFG